MKQETILVTGVAGFIGFHVAKKLLELGHTVIGIDNFSPYYDIRLKKARNTILEKDKNYTFIKLNLTTHEKLVEKLEPYQITKICHLAAQAGVRYSLIKPFAYPKNNISGFLSILELARKKRITDIVYASSSSVYGANKMPKTGFSESDSVTAPISLYAATKISDELLAYTYHHLYDLHLTGLRFFTVYGPWGRPDMALFTFTNAIYHGNKIDVYNNGLMKRDFTYIDDIVTGVIAAIEKSYPLEVINLGNSHPVDLLHFISCIEKEVGKKANLQFLPLQSGEVVDTYANITKAKEKLSFSPLTSIEQGIKAYVNWYSHYYGR